MSSIYEGRTEHMLLDKIQLLCQRFLFCSTELHVSFFNQWGTELARSRVTNTLWKQWNAKYASHLKILHPIRLPVTWKSRRVSAAQWLNLVKLHVRLFTYLLTSLATVSSACLSSVTRQWLIYEQNWLNWAAGSQEPDPSGAARAWPGHADHCGNSQCSVNLTNLSWFGSNMGCIKFF